MKKTLRRSLLNTLPLFFLFFNNSYSFASNDLPIQKICMMAFLPGFIFEETKMHRIGQWKEVSDLAANEPIFLVAKKLSRKHRSSSSAQKRAF
jgi:hypothetical protein